VKKEKWRASQRSSRKIKRAVTLVMLQPPTPARELTAWMHVPPQPLMRSLLSQSLTPTSPSQNQSVFSGPGALRIASPDGSLSLLRTGDCLLKPTLSAVDARNPNVRRVNVNAEDWCKERKFSEPRRPRNHLEKQYLVVRDVADTCSPQKFPQNGSAKMNIFSHGYYH
jgi:hypothetical protein